MNEPTTIFPEQIEREPSAPAAAPLNPNLSAALRENYDTVQEDLLQAKEVAENLEMQLAGKSRQMLHLKFLLDQTKSHLGHMQDSVVAMRAERHKLANEAMRAMGLDFMLARVTAERDRLKNELEGILEGLATDNAQKALRFDKRDHHIAELTFELMKLRQEVADLRRLNPAPAPVVPGPPPRPRTLKTSSQDDSWIESQVEIVPMDDVGGERAND